MPSHTALLGKQAADGRVLENNAVVPDITVTLDRGRLLQWNDAQPEAALEYLEGRVGQ